MFAREFQRITGACVLLAFAATLQAQKLIEVYPTGLYPDDVKRVQVVLEGLGDGGDGIILLKSINESGEPTAFNFGTDPDPAARGQAAPRADWSGAIEFRGEHCRDQHTVIEGGYNTITTNRHDAITVSGIEFRGAYHRAIAVRESTGTRIFDNLFVGTTGNFQDTVVRPIDIAADANGSRTEITGVVEVRGNRIDGASGWFSQGIGIVTTNAEIVIADNAVSGVNVGLLLSIYQKGAKVFGNDFLAEVPRQNFFSAGVQVNPGQDSTASVNITGNHISVVDADDNGEAYGVVGTAYDGNGGDFANSLIYGNVIETKNAYIGIALVVGGDGRSVSDNIVARNTVLGAVPYGIALYEYEGSGRLLGNRVVHNHLSGMTPGVAQSHVWLGSSTRDTLCAVETGNIVTDHGVNNTIIM